MGRKKFTSRAEMEAAKAAAASKKSSTQSGKTTTIVASGRKRRGGEIDSSLNEVSLKKGKCSDTLSEHRRVVVAKRHSQNKARAIEDDDDKSEKGEESSCVSSNASVHVMKVVAPSPEELVETRRPEAESPVVVDYGDDKLFADLVRVHDYYYEWRAQHPDVDVWDGSPAFVNFSASRFTEVLEKRIWHEINVCHEQIWPEVNIHKCKKHFHDPIPEIDKRLWSVEQWIALSKKRCINPCEFYEEYFGDEGLLAVRVQEARHWSKTIIANLAVLRFTLDCESGKKVLTVNDANGGDYLALATPTNETLANNAIPTNPTEVITSNARPKDWVDYGDYRLFRDLAWVHDYYYDWRAQHPDVDVWDGSPAFINFSASRFTEVLEERIQHEILVRHQQIWPEHNMHKCDKHSYDPNPEIDKRLWSVEQWILLSKKRTTHPCVFYDNYFGKKGLLSLRVQEARHWLEQNIAKMAFLREILDAESGKMVAKVNSDFESNEVALANSTVATVSDGTVSTNPTMVSISTAPDTTGNPIQREIGHHTVENIQPEDNSSSVSVALSNPTNPTMVSTSTASDTTGTPIQCEIGHHMVEINQTEDNSSTVTVAPSNPTNPTMVSTSTVLDTIDSPIRRKIGHPTVEINKPEDYSFSVSVASNNHKPAMTESVLDSHLLQQLPPVLDGFARSTVTLPKQ